MVVFMASFKGVEVSDKPLSPLLFGLCLEVFSRSLKVVSKRPGFHFHPMCADTEITHLAYADDLLLFARGDESTIAMIADCLQDFGDMAGLRANPLKSSIYFAGVDPRTRDTLLALTGFQQGGFPFRYLGIPLATEKLRISNYGALIDAAEVNIMAQTYIILCREARIGKDGLARSGIWLSILPIPNGVIDKLYAICRKKVAMECGTYTHGILLSYVVLFGTYNAKKIHYGFAGYTIITSGEWTYGNGKVRHCIYFSPLIKRLLQLRDQLVQQTGGP
ncbi:uncharacterized protein LOC141830508 [Curcuma longa]|uniref:uncharacterized protein LOC141830508 n=1 Tax=Curcuma longa TaxID=136217 RepID=UPI003D9EAB14